MCGIAAAIGRLDDATIAGVGRANDAQVRRGPDAQGRWRSGDADQVGRGGVDFAFRRLKIIDLSPAGNQPMVDHASGNVLIFNGEIYNFRVLRSELEGLGHRFASQGDSEVILKAYAQWGEECIARLRGMFGLAIWDPTRRSVLVARDRLGIKPVYWSRVATRNGHAVLIASTLRGLLATGLVSPRLDRTGLATYLWNGFVVGPGTIVEGVSLLPAGTTATVDITDPRIEPRRYWSIPAAVRRTSDATAAASSLQEAVSQHLVSDVPLGIFLSGGKDSSAVAALAVRGSTAPVRTFTITFEEEQYDESTYARRVAEALGTEHHEVPLTGRVFRDGLEGALDGIDQPTFDAINSYFVSRAVRQAGLTVAVAGTGGDELFGGYRSFRDIPRAAAWARRLSAVPAVAMMPAAEAVARVKAMSFGPFPPQTRWGRFADAIGTRGRTVELYQVAYGLFTRRFLRQLDPEATTLAPFGLPPGRLEELRSIACGRGQLEAISALELEMFLGERLLRDTDAASMEVSLEVRVPLVDHEFVEAMFHLDQVRRFEPVRSKALLSEIALGDIPPEVFDRPKRGFELPLDLWCKEELRGPISDLLANRSLCESVGISADAVQRLWHAYQSGAPGLYWSRVWSLFVLLWWCRRHGVTLN
ncbi:MAG: asparagine synthase (glutamine-hydrolyzing) [Phycisphaeraceae bacterium]|nr:asparagine synthase (glutamine-hydrolyzing) [Phycisphaeraceae bacterium]